MKTIRQYADETHLSYEAVRKKIDRYKKDLRGHVKQHGRTRYLDDYACAFLDQKRRENMVVVTPEDNAGEIDRLKRENDELKNQLLTAQRTIIQLQQDNAAALELKGRCEALLTTQEKTESALKEAQDRITLLQADTARLQAEKEAAEELSSQFKKGLFGLYWRSKKG